MSNWGTRARTVRIDDGLWLAAQQKAAQEGTTVSEHIREELTEWTESK